MKKTRDRTADAGLLEPRLLRLFDAVYSSRSVTRAADQLGQSQPTLSLWLGRLRRQLDDPLFVRTPAGMLPTPRAEALIAKVREALQALRELAAPRPGFDPSSATRSFRLCVSDASHITLLPRLLAHVRAVAPGVKLVAARIDGDTPAVLQRGDADIAIGSVPWLEAGLYQQTLFPQDWVCLANPSHPRIGKRLTLRAYKEEGHVVIAPGTGSQVLEEALAQQRIQRRVILELPGFLGLGGIVAATDVIATLPRQIGEALGQLSALRVLACPFEVPSFMVKQHWHARVHDDAGHRWLRGVVAGLYMGRPQRLPGSPKVSA